MSRPTFTAMGGYFVKGKRVFSVALDRQTDDFAHLQGHEVEIDGRAYLCIGVERFQHMPPWREGESIGLMVKPVEMAAPTGVEPV